MSRGSDTLGASINNKETSMRSERVGGWIACGLVAAVISAAGAQPENRGAQPRQDQPAEKAKPEGARPEGEARRPEGRAGGDVSNVESAMKLINRNVRRLRQQVADPEK